MSEYAKRRLKMRDAYLMPYTERYQHDSCICGSHVQTDPNLDIVKQIRRYHFRIPNTTSGCRSHDAIQLGSHT